MCSRQMRVPVDLIEYPREDHVPLAIGIFGEPSLESWNGFDVRQRIVASLDKAFAQWPDYHSSSAHPPRQAFTLLRKRTYCQRLKQHPTDLTLNLFGSVYQVRRNCLGPAKEGRPLGQTDVTLLLRSRLCCHRVRQQRKWTASGIKESYDLAAINEEVHPHKCLADTTPCGQQAVVSQNQIVFAS